MSKRKGDIILDDQETPKKQKCDQNQARTPLQSIDSNIKSKADEISKNVEKVVDDIAKKQNSLNQIKIIKQELKNAKLYGESSVGGEASELPVAPGIVVKNFGDVSIPITSEQAEELIKVCKQAPFGLNFETLVDTNVRDSYELQPDQIKIKNKSWNKSLDKLVERVAKELGCVGKVQASLYKMLLYKQGGHFKKHRDTEKEKGMFGTLIIQLPSIYTGGELMVYDNSGAQFKYDFGQAKGKSSNLVHYAAHYADLEHEILEVKSGYRTVLIYNLCWENGNGTCLSINDAPAVSSLASSLSILNESFVPLALILDHKYTNESFQTNGIKALKRSDNQRYNLLKNASDKLPEDKKLNFYVVSASLKVIDMDKNPKRYKPLSYKEPKKAKSKAKKSADSDSDDENDVVEHPFHKRCDYEICQYQEVEDLFDSNGRMYKDLKFDFSFFKEIIDLKKDVNEKIDIKDRKAWGKYISVEEEEYTGNAEANITTMYHKYFLLILPKSKQVQVSFGLSLSLGADKVIDLWKILGKSNKEAFVSCLNYMFKQLHDKSISSYSFARKNLIRDDQVNKILEILVLLNDVSLAQFYVEKCFNNFREKHCAKLAGLIKQFGFEKFRPSFLRKEFFRPESAEKMSANCRLVQSFLDLKEEKLALEFFNEFIKPALSNNKSFSDIKVLKESSYKENIKIYFELFKSIRKFEKSVGYEENMESFKDAIIKTLTPEQYEKLLGSFMSSINEYSSIKQILDLFKHRVAWLEDKINNFSWCMPNASIYTHKKVEDFLRSDKQQMTLNGFEAIKYAQRFVDAYGGVKEEYSTEMNIGGEGANFFVTITKTRDYYERPLNQYKTELAKIKSFNLNM